MIYYLKVNQDVVCTYKNLQNWMNVISGIEDAQMVIIADNPDVVRKIVNVNHLYKNTTFISSERTNPELVEIAEHATDERWRNAGYAHLTTFLHAREHAPGQPFWNIDADDTYFCVSAERLRQILLEAEKMAHERGYAAYSLDMNRTITRGVHWSFGITYTDHSPDWIPMMKKACKNPEWECAKEALDSPNIDWFFTWLGLHTDVRLGTFYVDNLRFVHFAVDLLRSSWFAGILHWKDGKLYLPMLRDLFQINAAQGEIRIPEDVDRINIGLDEEESLLGMRRMAFRVNEDTSMDEINNWLENEWDNWKEREKIITKKQNGR